MNAQLNIVRPTLLLDVTKCRSNIERMSQKFRNLGVVFRPHFKTHQSREIGRWFRDYGTDRITVSSMGMAAYFADDGWDDITVAFPVNLLEKDLINSLAERVVLNLVVEDPFVIERLDRQLRHRVGVMIKIDTGYERTGLKLSEIDNIEACVKRIEQASFLELKGFLAHAGHTYKARDEEEIKFIYQTSVRELAQLRSHFGDRHPNCIVSFGDTPGASMMEQFDGIDEMRPGNFVFYDLMQLQIGSCVADEIAVALICPVVACHDKRQECVIYGGGIHLSKDFITKSNDEISFGTMVHYESGAWDPSREYGCIRQLSQEHGVIKLMPNKVNTLRPGQLMAVLPVHSCMTAQCIGQYITREGGVIDHFATARTN